MGCIGSIEKHYSGSDDELLVALLISFKYRLRVILAKVAGFLIACRVILNLTSESVPLCEQNDEQI